MFEDLGEQQYVFSLLDEWAQIPGDYDLTYQTGSKSNFNKELTKLIKAIESKEQETIKKNPKLKLGFSFQSELLAKLWLYLTSSDTPPKLLANLSDIKILLLQAMIIGIDIRNGTLEFENSELKPFAAVGKRRKSQVDGWQKDGAKAAKKHTDDDHKSWLKQANELIKKNSKLSVRGIAASINKTDKKSPPAETVRKYLLENWVNPSNQPT